MKKVVISGSSKLEENVKKWIKHFESKGFEVIDHPIKYSKEVSENYLESMKMVFKEFYTNLERTDVYFLMNEEKHGIQGYIGASAIAELTYVVILNLLHHKNIDIYILNMPSKEVSSYEEVKLWSQLGWIQLYEK